MSTKSPRHGADGSARHSAEPSAPRRDHLRVVGPDHDPSPDHRRDQTFHLMQQHMQLATRLGVGPLTVAERARSMLESACAGWRHNGKCITADARPCAQPHEACLLAQYHHDLLLLEHGLLDPLCRLPEAVPQLACSSASGAHRKRLTT